MEQVKNTQVQSNEHAALNAANKEAEFKARKAEAAKAFAERQKQLKAERLAAVKELKQLIDSNSLLLPENVKAWIAKELNTGSGSKSAGTSFFTKVFGDSPKVGDKVTLMDYMKKTLKAKADLDKAIKQWSEKGIVVEYKENKDNMFESTYTIKKLA